MEYDIPYPCCNDHFFFSPLALRYIDVPLGKTLSEKTADISRRHHRSPCETTFPAQLSDRIDCSVPSVSDILVCEDSVRCKLNAVKPNKSAGPDVMPPNLLKEPELAIVSPLTGLFSYCAHLGKTLLIGRKLGLIPVYTKEEADPNNYRPDIVSKCSKIMASCVSETAVRHVF